MSARRQRVSGRTLRRNSNAGTGSCSPCRSPCSRPTVRPHPRRSAPPPTSACPSRTSPSPHATVWSWRRGTSRRPTAQPSCSSTGRGRRGPPCSATPRCWPSAASASCCSTPAAHGSSSGHAMDLGWHGDTDLAAAAAALRDSPDVTARHRSGRDVDGWRASHRRDRGRARTRRRGRRRRDRPAGGGSVAAGVGGDRPLDERPVLRGTGHGRSAAVRNGPTDRPTHRRARLGATADASHHRPGSTPGDRGRTTAPTGGTRARRALGRPGRGPHPGPDDRAPPEEWDDRAGTFLERSLLN
jgi:hypothetical protein